MIVFNHVPQCSWYGHVKDFPKTKMEDENESVLKKQFIPILVKGFDHLNIFEQTFIAWD